MEDRSYTHVIFDMDGLLLDTERIYTEATQEFVGQFGKTYEWKHKVQVMGRSEIRAAQKLNEVLDLPCTAEETRDGLIKILEKTFPDSQLLPGAERLIQHFHSCGVPMAVATGSATSTYNLKIQKHGELIKLFSHAVKSDDPELKHGKPAPDIYLLAASRFQQAPASPDKVLVFEDAPNGVTAAVAAGMKVVMVPDKRTDKSLCSQADMVLGSLEEFDPVAWGFPAVITH